MNLVYFLTICTNNIQDNHKSPSDRIINQIGHVYYQPISTTYQENDSYLEEKSIIAVEKEAAISLQKFVHELKSLNIYDHLNQTM